MKTIIERATELYPIKKYGAHAALIQKASYIRGAVEQKAIDIEKTCEWLDRYLHLFVMKGHINHSALEQEFRKAMEE